LRGHFAAGNRKEGMRESERERKYRGGWEMVDGEEK